MLTIRRDQMRALEVDTDKRVAEGYTERLQRDAPGACEGTLDDSLRTKIDAAVADGRSQGLTGDEDLYRYVLLAAFANWRAAAVSLDHSVSDPIRRVALALDRTAERMDIDACNADGAPAGGAALRSVGASDERCDRQGAIVPCPLARRWKAIEIEVVGEDDAGLSGVTIGLRRGDEGLYDVTDSAGRCRFAGLEDGGYTVGLPGVDADVWELASSAPLPPERTNTAGPARWNALHERPAAPPRHAVEPGECISSIAFDFGLLPGTLWDHGDNGKLRESRSNRNVLFEGDGVYIPPPRRKDLGVVTGNLYRLRRKGVPERLRIRFCDRNDQPLAATPYLLRITRRDGGAVRNRKGETDADGYVTEPIPPDADRGEVVLGVEPNVQRHPFLIGRLGPINTVEGLQGRLQNLGYFAGEQDGQMSEPLAGAIGAFQIDHDLQVTGVADAATKAKLVDVHRS